MNLDGTRRAPSAKGFRLALATSCVCFLLLLAGGLVHATGSGLACPDWPLCHGQVFPRMEGGVLFEHGHRLIALTVALLTIALGVTLWRRRAESHLGGVALLAVVLVIVQALLGAVTVLLRLPMAVKTVHLAVSVAFFCLLLFIVFRASATSALPVGSSARRFVGVAALALYAQILIGALVRHTGSGLACSDLILCGGELWPEWGPAKLQMLHRIVALVVAVLVIASSVAVSRSLRTRGERPGRIRLLVAAPHGLVLLQIALGMLSIKSFLGVATVTAHLGIAVVLLADLVLLYLSLAPEGAPHTALYPAAAKVGT